MSLATTRHGQNDGAPNVPPKRLGSASARERLIVGCMPGLLSRSDRLRQFAFSRFAPTPRLSKLAVLERVPRFLPLVELAEGCRSRQCPAQALPTAPAATPAAPYTS